MDISSKLLLLHDELPLREPDPWLNHMSASQAFVVCVGAGPWKIGRRIKVQETALLALGDRDLLTVSHTEPRSWYPLKWQGDKVSEMCRNLQGLRRTMTDYIHAIKQSPNAGQRLLIATGASGRCKVLDLFARDFMRINSFPIDRHVKRFLKEKELPLKEDLLIEECLKVGIDPSLLALRIAGQFVTNHIHKLPKERE